MADRIDKAYGATVAKRRLSRRLAEMREEAQLKPNEVDDQLGWKRGKLARIERSELSRREAAKLLNVSEQSVRRMLA